MPILTGLRRIRRETERQSEGPRRHFRRLNTGSLTQGDRGEGRSACQLWQGCIGGKPLHRAAS